MKEGKLSIELRSANGPADFRTFDVIELTDSQIPQPSEFIPVEQIVSPSTESDDPSNTCDFYVTYEGKFCLLPFDKMDTYHKLLSYATANPLFRFHKVTKLFRKRMEDAELAAAERAQLAPKKRITFAAQDTQHHSKGYAPGHWLTGAPALAGAITLAGFLGEKAIEGLQAQHFAPLDLKLFQLDLGWLSNPLTTNLFIVPLGAALSGFAMNYAANWMMAKIERKGGALSKDDYKNIWDDSALKAKQMGFGFLVVEGFRALIENALGTALESAWGGALQLGTAACPMEIRLALMLAMSLAIGTGMALGSVFSQCTKEEPVQWKEVATAFVIGAFAGAVASIDFGSWTLSFLSTWAALLLVPTAKLGTSSGREQEAQTNPIVSKGLSHLGHKFEEFKLQVDMNCGTRGRLCLGSKPGLGGR